MGEIVTYDEDRYTSTARKIETQTRNVCSKEHRCSTIVSMDRTTQKRALVIVLSVLVLALIGYLAYQKIRSGRVTTLDQLREQVSETGRVNVNPDGGSQILPNDIPMPANVQISESFDVASANGNIQGTRTYTSTKTIEEEIATYKTYMADNRWEIKDEKRLASYGALLAVRDREQMMVSITGKDGNLRVSVTAFASSATY